MRRAMISLVPLCLLLLVVAGSPAIGCGGSSGDTTSAGSQAVTDSQNKTQGVTNGVTQNVTVPEAPAPYSTASTAPQSVGEPVDGLQLSDIRWADHGAYFRIVFEMAIPGSDLARVPRADASMTPDHKQVKVILSGIRSLGSSANVTASSLNVGDSVVTSMTRVPSGDDQAIIYDIDLSKATSYSLAGLDSPGRIVVDITK